MAFRPSYAGLTELPERPHARYEIATLTDGTDLLRDIQRKLSLVQRQAQPLPRANPLPPRLAHDDRLGAAATKLRKSVLSPYAQNRLASEVYPVSQPPYLSFVPGKSSRHIGRDPVVTVK